jgi:small subunit ribosomal protein S20
MADAPNEKEKQKVTKRASAKKREIQDKKRRLINRAYRGEIRGAIKNLRSSIESGAKEKLKTALSSAFSVLDKGVKKSVIKKNKANRLKARLNAAITK